MNLRNHLEEIRQLAAERRSENLAFLKWLLDAPTPDAELDAMVSKLGREAMAEMDCVECHNCCVEHQPQATQAEVGNLAAELGVSVEGFLRDYTTYAPLADVVLRRQDSDSPNGPACVLLERGACRVYGVRMAHCRSYPDMEDGGIRERMWDLVAACSVCPAVFSVYEQLKAVFAHQRQRPEG